jgi:hypothetical protein
MNVKEGRGRGVKKMTASNVQGETGYLGGPALLAHPSCHLSVKNQGHLTSNSAMLYHKTQQLGTPSYYDTFIHVM